MNPNKTVCVACRIRSKSYKLAYGDKSILRPNLLYLLSAIERNRIFMYCVPGFHFIS
jgi:hypothetical protein